MTIIIDSREHEHKIQNIKAEFDKQRIIYDICALPVGDYVNLDNARVSVDRKHNLSELVNNLGSDSSRFYREIKRAFRLGIKLIVLCEHGGKVQSIEDVANWKNPMLRKQPLAITGRDLMERIHKISVSYNIQFVFCDKRNTGKKIIELLSL